MQFTISKTDSWALCYMSKQNQEPQKETHHRQNHSAQKGALQSSLWESLRAEIRAEKTSSELEIKSQPPLFRILEVGNAWTQAMLSFHPACWSCSRVHGFVNRRDNKAVKGGETNREGSSAVEETWPLTPSLLNSLVCSGFSLSLSHLLA